eukprot:snap_masked-scaffold_8-processed-gene-14.36-mRNA-1 protein AED:1.00 eAED:1.00 QI:0/0/0/0/1/1/2/0/241
MKIEYYFDVVSPYTALSLAFLTKYKDIWNFELILKPVCLGDIMTLAKNRPPGLVPNKQRYMMQELSSQHLPKLFGYELSRIPLNFFGLASQIHIFQSAVVAGQEYGLSTKEQLDFIQALTDGIYQDGDCRDEDGEIICDSEFVWKCFDKSGIDGKKVESIMKLYNQKEFRKNLMENAKQLVKRGGFGSPTMFISDEKKEIKEFMVFGSDRFELISNVCGLPYFGANLQLKISFDHSLKRKC